MQKDNKQEKIVSMFDDKAPTYDTANRVMSMGVDISWRKRLVASLMSFMVKTLYKR